MSRPFARGFLKKKENLIGAEERGTRPKRQTEMVLTIYLLAVPVFKLT